METLSTLSAPVGDKRLPPASIALKGKAFLPYKIYQNVKSIVGAIHESPVCGAFVNAPYIIFCQTQENLLLVFKQKNETIAKKCDGFCMLVLITNY